VNGELAADYPAWHLWRGRNSTGRETDWNATLKGRTARRAATAAGMTVRLTAADGSALRQLLEHTEVSRERAAWAA
jgi:hypothetical protein